VLFIAEQFQGTPVKSRMGVFPEIFSMRDSGPKNTESKSTLKLYLKFKNLLQIVKIISRFTTCLNILQQHFKNSTDYNHYKNV